jgi:hypothetical protein
MTLLQLYPHHAVRLLLWTESACQGAQMCATDVQRMDEAERMPHIALLLWTSCASSCEVLQGHDERCATRGAEHVAGRQVQSHHQKAAKIRYTEVASGVQLYRPPSEPATR